MANKSTRSFSHVLAALLSLQSPQTAVFVDVIAVVTLDSALIVVLGKRVALIQATPTWIKLGVPTPIAFNPTAY